MKVKPVFKNDYIVSVSMICSPEEFLVINKALKHAYGDKWKGSDTLIAERMLKECLMALAEAKDDEE